MEAAAAENPQSPCGGDPMFAGASQARVRDGNADVSHSGRRSLLDSFGRGWSLVRPVQRPCGRGPRRRARAPHTVRPLPRGDRGRAGWRALCDRGRPFAARRRGEPRSGRHGRRREPPDRLVAALSLWVRCWRGGSIPDLGEAVCSPRRLSGDPMVARRLLGLVAAVPTPVWGRDELKAGEMWNSNSVVAWLIASAGVSTDELRPPPGGRAPGWFSGLEVARRSAASSPPSSIAAQRARVAVRG
jgi:hypothetical protein